MGMIKVCAGLIVSLTMITNYLMMVRNRCKCNTSLFKVRREWVSEREREREGDLERVKRDLVV